jgi:hypothetical protein
MGRNVLGTLMNDECEGRYGLIVRQIGLAIPETLGGTLVGDKGSVILFQRQAVDKSAGADKTQRKEGNGDEETLFLRLWEEQINRCRNIMKKRPGFTGSLAEILE